MKTLHLTTPGIPPRADSYTSGGRTWRDSHKKNRARGMDYRAPTPPGLKPKDLIGIPWTIAFALQADGWYHRSDIIWNKPNCQPESVKDRPTRAHEYVFLFSKSEHYFYSADAIKRTGYFERERRASKSALCVEHQYGSLRGRSCRNIPSHPGSLGNSRRHRSFGFCPGPNPRVWYRGPGSD